MIFYLNKIEYHLVDHCNLNCAGCSHYAVLAKPRFADIKLFEKNVKQLVRLLDNSNIRLKFFHLLGGEPLLHPEIEDFCKIARKLLPDTIIKIKTNGILLNKMPDSFFNCVKENNIKIEFSDYHILNNEISADIVRDKELFSYNYIGNTKKPITKCPVEYFNDYSIACMQLEENGDLHFCGYSANIKFYDEYYGFKHEVIKDQDYVNIFDNNVIANKIFSWSHKKRPFCDYCRTHILKKWHAFNDKNEWISE